MSADRPLSELISIVIVTSPTPAIPCTELINTAMESFNSVHGLERCKIYIVMDGVEVYDHNRTKKGRITAEMAILYEQYHAALCERYPAPRYEILKCETHQGFAHAVKHGLLHVTTSYAIIAQHDRVFSRPFHRLNDLISQMEQHTNIRYIGFPSSSNKSHDRALVSLYDLSILNRSDLKRHLGDNMYLQPLIFWFDSNHLCHVQRYLEIYRPFSNLPPDLKALLGVANMKKMILKPGDFIEDKWGQMQRILLSSVPELVRKNIMDKATNKGTSKLSIEAEQESSVIMTGFHGDAIGTTSISTISSSDLLVPQPAGDVSESTGGGDSEACDAVVDSHQQLVDHYRIQLFLWYGSYLCWSTTSPFPYQPQKDKNKSTTVVLVRHLKGRQQMNASWANKVQQQRAMYEKCNRGDTSELKLSEGSSYGDLTGIDDVGPLYAMSDDDDDEGDDEEIES